MSSQPADVSSCTGERVYLQLQLLAVQRLQVMQRLLAQAPPPVSDNQ